MMDDDAEIRRTVLARDALRRESGLPPLDIEYEVSHAWKQRQRTLIADTFTPHAIIVCERSVPTSIMGAGLIGISNILKLDLDQSQDKESFPNQALLGLQHRLKKYEKPHRIGLLPYFDKPRFIAINYSHNLAVVYTLKGSEIKSMNTTYKMGSVVLLSGGERIALSTA
ncbi:hypothetical protein FV219_00750 [Methylobacterium sp. WL122]|nr:hypothetical protein FV219_00750 [Methylobacterium sp. WL122]